MSKTIRTLALLLAALMLFTLGSCGKTDAQEEETTTQTVTESAEPEETTGINSISAAPEDKAAILAIYNNAANKTKANAGKMQITRTQGRESKLTETSFSWLSGIIGGLFPNDYPCEEGKTFINGLADDGSGMALSDFLPPAGEDFMSRLPLDGVKDAKCEKEGDGYSLTLTLVEERGSKLDDELSYHSSCMDIPVNAEDLNPFSFSGEVVYHGAVIKAKINKDGLLTSIDIYEPVSLSGRIGYYGINFIRVAVEASWKQTIEIIYM